MLSVCLSVCRSEEVGKSGSACSTLAAAAVSRRFCRPAHTLLSLPPHTFCSQLPPYALTLSLPSSLSVCVSPSLPSSLSLPLFLLPLQSGCSSLLLHALSLHLSKCWRNIELRQRKLRRTEERSERVCVEGQIKRL